MIIKEIIQKLHTTMVDARGQESHFESWLTQNEGICDAIDMLKELAKQEQGEPVAMYREKCADGSRCLHGCHTNERCYNTPQQRKPLTFEQVEDCFPEGASVFEDAYGDYHTSPRWLHAFARAIEAAHGITKENT